MKKIPRKCGCCRAVKRCVFKVQNSNKQGKLQTRTLLSEQRLHLTFNRYAKNPDSRNTGADWRTLNSNETALKSRVFENFTVH